MENNTRTYDAMQATLLRQLLRMVQTANGLRAIAPMPNEGIIAINRGIITRMEDCKAIGVGPEAHLIVNLSKNLPQAETIYSVQESQ